MLADCMIISKHFCSQSPLLWGEVHKSCNQITNHVKWLCYTFHTVYIHHSSDTSVSPPLPKKKRKNCL